MDLRTAERQLQAAQRDADVESLDALLHPRVVGAGPDGTVGDLGSAKIHDLGEVDPNNTWRHVPIAINRLLGLVRHAAPDPLNSVTD